MNNGNGVGGVFVFFAVAFVAGLIALGMCGCPKYKVYSSRLEGEALLAHAQAAKEVAVAEARARKESAVFLAEAEVERAKGVAAANKIIGDSLKGNEDYLRYLWITDVAGNGVEKTVVYIPTEGNMPVLEATRFMTTPDKK